MIRLPLREILTLSRVNFTSIFFTRVSPADERRDLSTSVRTRRSTAIGFQPNWIRLYKHHGDKPADLVVSMNRSRMKTNRWGRSIVKLSHLGPHTNQTPTGHRKWWCQRGWSFPKDRQCPSVSTWRYCSLINGGYAREFDRFACLCAAAKLPRSSTKKTEEE